MNGYRECSSCGAWYTKSCACSKRGFAGKFVRKTPNSSQRLHQDCAKCENPDDGHYFRHYALLRKKLKEVWFKICDEQIFSQDFLNTSESSNDDYNVINAPQESIVFNQGPREDSSQSPPQINHQCCYGCGDPLDGIACRRCTCESCGNGAHIGYNCLLKVSIVSNPKPCHNQNVDELPQTLTNFHPTCYSGDEDSFAHDSTPNLANDFPNVFHPPPQTPTNSYEFCGNDAHYSYDCSPQVLYEVIKYSVEDLIPIPSESEDIPDNTCDVPFRDNSLPLYVSEEQFKEFSDSNDDSTSIDDDYFSIDNINYIELSPPDFELKSDTSLSYSDNSLPEFETFHHTKETNSGNTTTHADYSLPKYDSFLFEIKPDQGELTSVVILAEPRVRVPNVLTTHPTLMLDSDFIHFDNSLSESEIFYFDIEEKNSGSTTIHADISLPDLECFNFKTEPEPNELTSIVDSGIRENVLSAKM
nr:hypothetical protein [Tanacetum cinerariifolium]